jgi:hypothetical protein
MTLEQAKAALPGDNANNLLALTPTAARNVIAGYIGSLTNPADIAQVERLSGALDVLLDSMDNSAQAAKAFAQEQQRLDQAARDDYARAMQTAADDAVGNASRAFDDVARSIDALKTAASELYKSQSDAIKKSLSDVSTSLSGLMSLSSRIAGMVNKAAAEQPQAREKAQSELRTLLTGAKYGYIDSLTSGPYAERLDKALQTIDQGADRNRFSSTTAFNLDEARTQVTLGQIKALTDTQITDQELMQKTLDAQLVTLNLSYAKEIELLDKTLESARLQIAAMNGVTSSVIGLSTAMGALATAINAAEGAKAAAAVAAANAAATKTIADTSAGSGGLNQTVGTDTKYTDTAKDNIATSGLTSKYLLAYPTLAAAYKVGPGVTGVNEHAWALEHFINHGQFEGLVYENLMPRALETRASTYVDYYKDLGLAWLSGKTGFSTKSDFGLAHYENYGRKESPPRPFPAFDVGTNYLPADMLAQVHEGERIIPAADNRLLMQRLQNPQQNSAAMLQEIRALRQEVAELRKSNTRENTAIAAHSATTADATRSMDRNGVQVFTDSTEPLHITTSTAPIEVIIV